MNGHATFEYDAPPKPYTLSPRGLKWEGPPVWDDVEALFSKPVWESLILDEVHDGLPFIIGDVLNIAEDEWGEGYSQLLDYVNQFKHQTLYNYKSVCGKVPLVVRSGAKHVSFSHHAAVAKFWATPDKQIFYLRAAKDEMLTVAELRKFIREEENEDDDKPSEFKAALTRALNATGKLYDFPITHEGREALAVIRNAIQDFGAAQDVPDEDKIVSRET